MNPTNRPVLMAVLVIALLLAGCGASRSSQLAPVNPATPIHVGTMKERMDPIAFHRMIVQIPSESVIGAHHEGFLKVRQYSHTWTSGTMVAADYAILASQVMRDMGYPVLGGDNLVFGNSDGPKARFQLGGTLNELAWDTYGRFAGNYAESVVGITWELLDSRRDSVVFSLHTRGHATRQSGQGAVLHAAFQDAARRLLADTAFVTTILDASEATASLITPTLSSATRIEIRTCTPRSGLSLPADLEEVFRSVLIIRAGTTFGSGVLVSPEGYAVTAAHVVSGLERVEVEMRSGLTVTANVLVVDAGQDVALIRLPGNRHDCLPLADARSGLGTDLFAVGTPALEELSFSVSRGVVSGYRELDGYQYVQTDASLNPGNSGGPLLNASGEVVAVVSWKIVAAGMEGLAFGVPFDALMTSLGFAFGR